MDKDLAASEYKTPSLITPLSKRLQRWRAEIQPEQQEGQILPSLYEDLDYALELTRKVGIEPELVIFLIAISSWWFRVFYAEEAELKRILESQLAEVRFIPNFLRSVRKITVLDRYVSTQLSKLWPCGPTADEEDSDFIISAFQSKCWAEIGSLSKQWSGPFLVSDYVQLPRRRGGYPEWGPWVAAVAVHQLAIRRRKSKKDSLPLECADAILKALRGCDPPDKTRLYQCERVIASPPRQLLGELVRAYRRAEKMTVQDDSIEPFIDEDCFPSLTTKGGKELLLFKFSQTSP